MKLWTGVSRYHDEKGTRQAIFGSFDSLTSAFGVIAQFRVPAHGLVRAYLQTFGILVVAAGLSIGATLIFNLVG